MHSSRDMKRPNVDERSLAVQALDVRSRKVGLQLTRDAPIIGPWGCVLEQSNHVLSKHTQQKHSGAFMGCGSAAESTA